MKEEDKKTNNQWISIIALIIALAAWRAFVVEGSTSLLANLTPIGAIALFAGANFQNRMVRYLFPLGILMMSDVLMRWEGMDNAFLYSGWMWVYLAFTITIFFGEKMSKLIKIRTVFLASLASALVHWILSDFGYWIGGGINILTNTPFERTAQDLLVCYSLGFPFFLKLAASTFLYSVLIFSLYSLLNRNPFGNATVRQ